MFAKHLTIYLAVVALAVVTTKLAAGSRIDSYAANKSHHFTVGFRQPGDRLVLKQNIIKSSSWMKVVTVQQTFNTTRFERITMVQALDQKTNGNGAYASLLGGGPGYSNATLRFKSQRGHGINFVVELYAR